MKKGCDGSRFYGVYLVMFYDMKKKIKSEHFKPLKLVLIKI